MKPTNNQRDVRNSRSMVLAWAWAVLLVVLLSAAPTGAQPGTRLIGSAFDPATVSVALRSEQLAVDAAAVPLPKRKHAGEQQEACTAVAPCRSVALLPTPAERPFSRIGREGLTGWLTSTRAHGPRAPPAT